MSAATQRKYWLNLTLVALAYLATAQFGSHLSVMTDDGIVSSVWLATGLGLAVAILKGWRIWPGIFIGAIFFNLLEHRPFWLAIQLSVNNTLEAVLPALLLARIHFHAGLDRLRDCLAIWLAFNLGAALSASLGVLTLVGLNLTSLDNFGSLWFIWFFANTTGSLVVGCLILTWSCARWSDWNIRRALELVAMLAAAVFVVNLIFFEPYNPDIWTPYLIFPVVVWAAVQFGSQGSTLVSATISGLATWAVLNGGGHFQSELSTDNILSMQSFIIIIATTSLLLASATQTLRQSEQTLRQSEENMAIAQQIAHFGSWELELNNSSKDSVKPLRWSAECYRIFGFEPHSMPITNDLFYSCVHPDDRESVARAIAKAINDKTEYSLNHRVILRDGEIRHVRAEARVFPNEHTGQPFKMIGTVHDITETQRAGVQLRESEERYRLLADNATDMISRQNMLGVFLYVSPACRQLLGYDPEDLVGRDVQHFLHPDDVPAVQESNRSLIEKTDQSITYRFRRRNGSYVWVETTSRGLQDPFTNRINELICISRDITERRTLESQLQQAQKMDAIGQLAGGIAHDFNNLLTVISGYVGMILTDLPAEHPTRKSAMEIHKASDRAAGLTRQLLAFSRRTMLDPKVIDLNALVADSENMIRRLIGENIEFITALAADSWHVKVDRTQMDQVILNLVVNARDAMPQGGKLMIETTNVVLDKTYVRNNADAHAGPHVLLAISDTGVGMSNEVLDRIFEPFFTTKGLGKGTGLGLATAYGIVKQSGGHISVNSEVGQGSTFKIYMPSVSQTETTDQPSSAPNSNRLVSGRGTILLVEDEEAVRLYAERVLFDAGYRVLSATNGEEALEVAAKFLDQIDILITDVVMPRMGGRQVAETLRAKKPGLKTLFMSGYTDDAILRHGVLSAKSAFLQKPFSNVTLSQKVRDVMQG